MQDKESKYMKQMVRLRFQKCKQDDVNTNCHSHAAEGMVALCSAERVIRTSGVWRSSGRRCASVLQCERCHEDFTYVEKIGKKNFCSFNPEQFDTRFL